MSDARDPDRGGPATVSAEQEIRALRQELRDLVAVLSLPLMWRGRTPQEIAENLAEVLMSLLRLDFLSLRVDAAASGKALQQTRRRTEDEELRTITVEPGIQAEHWHVTAGSRRSDFPTDTERFLLRVSVDQAAVAIETARLYHEAQQASLAKSQFIATMSHELRTPLNAILGYVDLLMLGVPEPVSEASRDQVDRIRTSARHLLELINGILSFARMEAGHEEVHAEPFDLCVLTRETAELVEPLARSGGLAFECRVPDSAVVVTTDVAKVRQILLNLLSNAIKFTDEGRVEISLEAEEDAVRIHVRDTGAGIPQTDLERIFEPFRQLEGTFTRRSGGTGLGLSVARGLSSLLGASLGVESEVGRGSTFTLRMGRPA